RRADDLDAHGVLRPADRVGECAGAFGSRVPTERLRDVEEVADAAAARLRDELRRVAGEMALEDLEDAPWVLQRQVFLGRLALLGHRAAAAVSRLLALRELALLDRGALVLPLRGVVRALRGIRAGEEPVEVLGVRELVRDDRGCVRVVLHVLVEPALVLEDVVDDAAEERDVGPGADADVPRRHRARAREPWI